MRVYILGDTPPPYSLASGGLVDAWPVAMASPLAEGVGDAVDVIQSDSRLNKAHQDRDSLLGSPISVGIGMGIKCFLL